MTDSRSLAEQVIANDEVWAALGDRTKLVDVFCPCGKLIRLVEMLRREDGTCGECEPAFVVEGTDLVDMRAMLVDALAAAIVAELERTRGQRGIRGWWRRRRLER